MQSDKKVSHFEVTLTVCFAQETGQSRLALSIGTLSDNQTVECSIYLDD